jgi:hypothetical protein
MRPHPATRAEGNARRCGANRATRWVSATHGLREGTIVNAGRSTRHLVPHIQQIAMLIDLRRGAAKLPPPLNYAMFVPVLSAAILTF